eukprot:3875930-Pyramimonas_sp.AAC.4
MGGGGRCIACAEGSLLGTGVRGTAGNRRGGLSMKSRPPVSSQQTGTTDITASPAITGIKASPYKAAPPIFSGASASHPAPAPVPYRLPSSECAPLMALRPAPFLTGVRAATLKRLIPSLCCGTPSLHLCLRPHTLRGCWFEPHIVRLSAGLGCCSDDELYNGGVRNEISQL